MTLEEKLEFCKKLLEEAQQEAKNQLRFNDGQSIMDARRAIKEVIPKGFTENEIRQVDEVAISWADEVLQLSRAQRRKRGIRISQKVLIAGRDFFKEELDSNARS